MARKPSIGLTDSEHRIMNVLWDLSEATVGDVVERIEGPSRSAYNAVLTLLRILERKGYVRHEKQGRAFTYAPIVNRVAARRGALTHLLSRFFDGSREQLVMDLLGHDDVDADRLAQVKTLLNNAAAVARPGKRLSNVPQLITFTARIARVATLASSSFWSDVPQVLPSVLAGPVEIVAPNDEAVAPAIPSVVATSEPAQMTVEETMCSSAVHEALSPVSRPSVLSGHLSSISIRLLVRIPDVESTGGSGAEADGVDWAALGRRPAAAGTAVAKADTATGLAASRAGTSVSRFFKNGGLAIARSF